MWTAHLRSGERQRAIRGFPGYYVSDHGRVFSFKRQGFQCATIHLDRAPRVLKPMDSRSGSGWKPNSDRGRHVLTVSLKNGRQRVNARKVAQLVALAFIGPKPDGLGVLHWDDDHTNNRLSNLRYGTARENSEDMARNRARKAG